MTETSELSIYEKTFAKSNKTDAILVVDGKILHVNTELLCYHSDYFDAIFDWKLEGIEIKDVKFEDFATLLSLVHRKPLEINKKNAENLLKLADQFMMISSKLLIENVIKSSTEFSQFEKLLLADKYGLKDLVRYILGLYNTKEKFQDFYKSHYHLSELSEATKSKLFEIYFRNGLCY